MIDIHTHILPGIDDGAGDMEETLAMAKEAVKEGIHTLIATPHHANGQYDNPAGQVIDKVEKVNHALKEEGIPLTVYPGQEIRVYTGLFSDLEKREAISLNGSRYILLEFPTGEVPKGIEETIHELLVMKLIPIIAHPERNRPIASDPSILERLIRLGALSQVTSHSINGLFGKKLQNITIDMCKSNLVHFVSSDAHNLVNRGFGLNTAYENISSKLGGDITAFYQENARKLFENDLIETPDPVSVRKQWWKLLLNY